ncbi:MAG: hypothetical protein P9F75_00545 [Candidatus Contendobacter sp.]|nr:hypothetical protein [Candidatus Contendobacter sp.]
MHRDIRVDGFAPTAPPACGLALAAVLVSLIGCSGGQSPSGLGM